MAMRVIRYFCLLIFNFSCLAYLILEKNYDKCVDNFCKLMFSIRDQTNKNEVTPQFHTYIINHSNPSQVNPPSSISPNVPPITLPGGSTYPAPEGSGAGQVEAPGLVRIPEQIGGLGQVCNQENVGTRQQIGNPDQILNPRKIACPVQIEDRKRKQDMNLQSSSITSFSYPVANPSPDVTEDNLQYQFYSVSSGSLHFKVRASNDAHIALAMGVQESDPKIEIFIGGWGNSKSSISRKRTLPFIPLTRSVEVETPGILNGAKFQGFWVRWDGGIVSAGHEDRATPFISWSEPEPFPIYYVGVRTSWGATGTWKIEDGTEFNTSPKIDYVFKPCASGSVEFEYRGSPNCHVCLSTTPGEIAPIYEIILESRENTESEIRYSKHKPGKVTVHNRVVEPSRVQEVLSRMAEREDNDPDGRCCHHGVDGPSALPDYTLWRADEGWRLAYQALPYLLECVTILRL